jgi:ferric-dicitrate binding protein FerR (iron transport regulator)
VAAALVISWGIYRHGAITPASLASGSNRSKEISASAGARTKLVLPDGTRVWLNCKSRLNYSDAFNVNDREVTLQGEAYFEVATNSSLPFIVHASALDVKALGTAFAVKSYPQDETIEATLLKGAIEISRRDHPGSTRIILKPNEKLTLRKSVTPSIHTTHSGSIPAVGGAPSSDIAVNPIRQDVPESDKAETAWLYNRLVFDGDNFKQLANKMERWFNVRIVIRDSTLDKFRFSGIFEKETLDNAFRELQLTRDFIYKNNGNEIDLYAKQE